MAKESHREAPEDAAKAAEAEREGDTAAADRAERRAMFKEAGRVGTIGIEFGVSVVIGYFIGSWLDEQLGTAPWLMLLFIVFGLAAATRSLIRIARRMRREQSDEPSPPSGAHDVRSEPPRE